MKTKIKFLFAALMLFCIAQVNAQNSCNKVCAVSAGSNKTICCPPGSVTIGGSPCITYGGGGTACTYTYSWVPTTGLSSATVCNPTASPTVTTTYTLYVNFSGLCCCDGGTGSCPSQTCTAIQRSSTVKVTVNNTCCRLISPDQENEKVNSEINLFPNPTEGKFSLQFNQLVAGTCIVIYDANGKQAMFEANLDVNKKQFDYDLTQMAKGIYYVKVIEGESTLYLKKIVLQ
jgi:hypothetical protein